MHNIKKVPLTLIAGTEDKLCNMDSLQKLYFTDLKGHHNKKLRLADGAGHAYFAFATGNWVKEIIASIENTDGDGGIFGKDLDKLELWASRQMTYIVQLMAVFNPSQIKIIGAVSLTAIIVTLFGLCRCFCKICCRGAKK